MLYLFRYFHRYFQIRQERIAGCLSGCQGSWKRGATILKFGCSNVVALERTSNRSSRHLSVKLTSLLRTSSCFHSSMIIHLPRAQWRRHEGMGGFGSPTYVQTPLEISAKPLTSYFLYMVSVPCRYVYCDFLLLTSKEKLFDPHFFGADDAALACTTTSLLLEALNI